MLATLPSLEAILFILTLNKPSLLAVIPNIPASISANTDVPKNPNIVYKIYDLIFVSLILHIASVIDVNTIGTITNCSEFINS